MAIADGFKVEPPVQVGMWDLERGEAIMHEAYKWIALHPMEWLEFVGIARRWSRDGRKVSARDAAVYVRNEFRVSIPNAITPAFSRIAEAQYGDLEGRFTKSRSVLDEVV